MHVELLMAPAEDEKIFLRAAVDAIPKVSEIVCRFSPEDQSGALDAAERRFVKSARDCGCTEISARICDHAAFAQTCKSSTDKRSEIAGFAAKAH